MSAPPRGSRRGRGRGGSSTTTRITNGTTTHKDVDSSKTSAIRGRGRARNVSTQPRDQNATRQHPVTTDPRIANKARATRPANWRDPTADGNMDYDKRMNDFYQTLKKNRERARAEAIRKGLMADPNKPTSLEKAITIVGTCQDMCPEFDRVQRIVQNMVDRCEKQPSKNGKDVPCEDYMVKPFRRSAAGNDEQIPSDLRPPLVLQKTLNYLLDELVGGSQPLGAVHKFVWDRTRAIRNDFSIQQVTKTEDQKIAIDCFERIARFHILALHQLSKTTPETSEFNHFQEREQLNSTLLSLMYYYEDTRDKFKSPNEPEFRAYCIIFEIQDPKPDLEDRVSSWPSWVIHNRRVQTALKLYATAGNINDSQGPLQPRTPHLISQSCYGRFWKIIHSNAVGYLMACVSEIYFNFVRKTALENILKAYRKPRGNQVEPWSLADLRAALAFDKVEEVQSFCEDHGFTIVEVNDKPYLELGSVRGHLSDSAVQRKQIFNKKLVESKRCNRTLAAVINGISASEAQKQNLLETSETESESANSKEKSLFITGHSDDEDAGDQSETSINGGLTQAATDPKPFTNNMFGAPSTSTNPFATANATETTSGFFAPKLASGSSGFGAPSNAFGTAPKSNSSPFTAANMSTSQSGTQQNKPGLFGAPSPFGSGSNITQPGLFGQPSSTASNVQTSTDNSNPTFGAPLTSTFIPTFGGPFNIPATGASSPSIFGAPKTSVPSSQPPSFSFGQPKASTPSVFGQEQPPLPKNPDFKFGSTSSTRAFFEPTAEHSILNTSEKQPTISNFFAPNPQSANQQSSSPETSPSLFTPPPIQQSQASLELFSSKPPVDQPQLSPASLAESYIESISSPSQEASSSQEPLPSLTKAAPPPQPQMQASPPTSSQVQKPQSSSSTLQSKQALPPTIKNVNFNSRPRISSPLAQPPITPSLDVSQGRPSGPQQTRSEPRPQLTRPQAPPVQVNPKPRIIQELAQVTMLEPKEGVLDQFIVHNVNMIVKAAVRQAKDEESWRQAAKARRIILSKKYLHRWKNIAWALNLHRQGRERRKNLARSMLSLSQSHFRRSSEFDPHPSTSGSQEPSMSTVSQPKQAPPRQSTTRVTKKRSLIQGPLEQRSTKKVAKHQRSQTVNGAKMSKSTLFPPSLTRSNNPRSPLSSSLCASLCGSGSFAGIMRNSSNKSLPSGRMDNTKTNYFRLKALGIDEVALYSPKKRQRDQDESVNVKKIQRLSPKSKGSTIPRSVPRSTSVGRLTNGIHNIQHRKQSSPPPTSSAKHSTKTSTDPPDEDEALLAQVREMREQMVADIAWFQEEREKTESEMNSRRSSYSGSWAPSTSMNRTERRIAEHGAGGLEKSGIIWPDDDCPLSNGKGKGEAAVYTNGGWAHTNGVETSEFEDDEDEVDDNWRGGYGDYPYNNYDDDDDSREDERDIYDDDDDDDDEEVVNLESPPPQQQSRPSVSEESPQVKQMDYRQMGNSVEDAIEL
ncbi:MAG: hypothetical protein M1834_006159 [Cirrosporium novae-zelandiae]|nr:MAG: hypothetical protein M1834_006159 [Cirrosporium novae-zelandiae]